MILLKSVGGRRLSWWVFALVALLLVVDAWTYALRQVREIQFHAETAQRVRELQKATEAIGGNRP